MLNAFAKFSIFLSYFTSLPIPSSKRTLYNGYQRRVGDSQKARSMKVWETERFIISLFAYQIPGLVITVIATPGGGGLGLSLL